MKRIRYISSFAQTMERATIDTLPREAQKNNARNEITGVLVATG